MDGVAVVQLDQSIVDLARHTAGSQSGSNLVESNALAVKYANANYEL
jgi:hypothetical protein